MSETTKKPSEHKCPVCEAKKKKQMEWATGPDSLHGGDGLPDWMQFTITGGMFAILYWVLYLLFHPTLELDEIGTHDVIVSYDGKSIGKFSQLVTEENVREYAGVDILELRLSLLQTLESILEIIFGK